MVHGGGPGLECGVGSIDNDMGGPSADTSMIGSCSGRYSLSPDCCC